MAWQMRRQPWRPAQGQTDGCGSPGEAPFPDAMADDAEGIDEADPDGRRRRDPLKRRKSHRVGGAAPIWVATGPARARGGAWRMESHRRVQRSPPKWARCLGAEIDVAGDGGPG